MKTYTRDDVIDYIKEAYRNGYSAGYINALVRRKILVDDGLTYSTSIIGWTEIDGVKYLVTGEGMRITFDRATMDIFIKRCQEKAKRKGISFPRILSKEEYEKEATD